MGRVSKPPEIRKQELVDVALSLFMEKGYEAVSVRDILKVVNGHPGMFYYYFASKQEIYNEAMRQMVQRELDVRTKIICDKEKSVLIRAKELISQIQISINSFYRTFNSPDNIAYQTQVIFDLLTAMATPVSQFMLEAVNEGMIPPEIGMNEENAYSMSLFLLFGCAGVIRAEEAQAEETQNTLDIVHYLVPFISRFLGISEEMLTP